MHSKRTSTYYTLLLGILFSPSLLSLDAHTALQSLDPASGWYQYTEATIPSRRDWETSFVQDCQRFSSENDHIPPHTKNSNTVRIATYNIHFWCKPSIAPFNYQTGKNRHSEQDIQDNFHTIIAAIKTINADVVCLQEVLLFDAPFIERTLKEWGYEYIFSGDESEWEGSRFCVTIASKYPFEQNPRGKTFDIDTKDMAHPLEKHCFVKATVALLNKKITLYTSHFDCFDTTETIRYEEVKELIKDSSDNSLTDNIIICGDFNAVRAQDLQYSINGNTAWNLLDHDTLLRTKVPLQTKALDLFTAHGFSDCFSKGEIAMPAFSAWNGTVVDFIFLNNRWRLPITGCYFYYTAASDHLPVIMDIAVTDNQ